MKGAIIAVACLGVLTIPSTPQAQAGHLQAVPVVLPAPVRQATGPTALQMLASFGYSVNTPARADRAVRHWQRANGLVVDGIAGPQTLASLTAASAAQPATRVNPPARPVPQTDVESLIRAAWPDDSENEAVRIATRESRLQPGARNACCFGLFQIHFAAHRAWLAGLGVTSAAQLLDAQTNINAALALYQAAGWQPWTL